MSLWDMISQIQTMLLEVPNRHARQFLYGYALCQQLIPCCFDFNLECSRQLNFLIKGSDCLFFSIVCQVQVCHCLERSYAGSAY